MLSSKAEPQTWIEMEIRMGSRPPKEMLRGEQGFKMRGCLNADIGVSA
jgi:hypothetical protein